jgi:hypothetical protein
MRRAELRAVLDSVKYKEKKKIWDAELELRSGLPGHGRQNHVKV